MTVKKAGSLLLLVLPAAGSAAVAHTGHAVGLAGLLFFGVGTLVYAQGHLVSHPKHRMAHRVVRGARRYTSSPVGIVFLPRAPSGLSGVLGVPFLGVSVVAVLTSPLIADGDPTTWHRGDLGLDPPPVIELGYWVLVGGTTVLLGGVFGVDLARALARRAQGIAVLPDGVHLRDPGGTVWLPWENLADVRVEERAGRSTIVFAVHGPEAIKPGGWRRFRRGRRRRRFDADITRSGNRYRDPRGLAATIHHYRATPAARRRLAEPAELDALRRRRHNTTDASPPAHRGER